MKRFLIERAMRAAAKRKGADVDYTMALYDASPAALRHLGKAVSFLQHREAVGVEPAYAAQLVGALEEGCGSCVQIHVQMARNDGVPDAVIEAVLTDDGRHMSADVALAVRFAVAIARRTSDESDARQAVRTRWGDKGVIDLVMATQTSRFLSMLKAGFGHAAACGMLSVGERTVVPRRRAA
jgi:AhpD family alkylhydroperoxidase